MLRKRRCSDPAAAGFPPKLLARSVPCVVTVPVYLAVKQPVSQPACLRTKAVFTATQINPIKSVFSGVPAMFFFVLKTKPTHIQSSPAESVCSAVNVPVVLRPHSPTDTLNPTGFPPLTLAARPAIERLSAARLPAVISAPPASNAVNTASCSQDTGALELPSCHGQSPVFILPLAIHADAWSKLPGVSEWVLNTIKRGYSLQFARRPRRYTARVETTVKYEVSHLLRAEIAKLLSKGAIEPVSQAQSEGGLYRYSRYFLVPKKDGGFRPILDLRQLNRALVKRQFRMLTTRKILAQVRHGDWFMSIDLKDAYFQIQIASHHRRFLRFAFEGQAYQYTVLPFGLSLAPRTFTKCMDAALAPLRLRGMRVMNYLDDWLILARSRSELIEHRAALLEHLEKLGLTVNWAKSSLFPSQKISFLGTVLDSLSMTARLSPERGLNIQHVAKSFRHGSIVPLKRFQKMLGLMASAASVLQLGLLRMRPLQMWLKARVPPRAWTKGLLRLRVDLQCVSALEPWKVTDWYQSGVCLGTTSSVKVVSTDASTSGWGALLEGRPLAGLWSEREKLLHINCLEMIAVDKALQRFCPQIRGHHVLVRSDNMSVVAYINRQGGVRSRNLYRLTERLLVWAQHNLLSLKAAHVPGHLNVGPDRLSRNNVPAGEWSLHPQTVQLLWETFGRAQVDLFASHENAHCPKFFSKSKDALAHVWPRCPLYAFPPVSLLPQVLERIRENGCPVLLVAPLWTNQTWFPVLMQLTSAAPWPVPLRRDLLSQAEGSIWHPRPDLWSLHAWAINGYPLTSQREC